MPSYELGVLPDAPSKYSHGNSTLTAGPKLFRPAGTEVDPAAAIERPDRGREPALQRNIQARQIAEAALRASEERFKLAVRAVSDAVWDWDLLDNTLWWNDGFLTAFGFAADEIHPAIDTWHRRIHPDERDRVADSLQRAIASNTESWEAEYRLQRKDGSYAFVQDRGYILRDATGRRLRMVGGLRDRTAQKIMEAQFLRSQRMESIGKLAGGIAHDLNNMLAPIMMSVELLKLNGGKDPPGPNILDIIQISCSRGADLVRQVLSFAQGIEGERSTIRLRHLIDDLTGIIRGTFPCNIRISACVPNDLWPIAGEPIQLHQVLLNLAVNARDAMPNGGTLKMAATNVTLDAQYASMSPEARTGPHVLFQLTDTGSGIPPEVRARIFEPFFTTKAAGKGTGFGLATVHTVVKNHGGFLNVESEVGRGTTFKVYLPAQPGSRPADAAQPFPAKLPCGRDELVLVVDDEPAIRNVTQQTLEAFGYRVLTASDGAEAIALYARQTPQIAVVLTDMMMPVLDGAATIQVLRRINPAVKIIAVSGLDIPGTVAKATAASTYDFLPKPYNAETLLKRIRDVLDLPVPGPS